MLVIGSHALRQHDLDTGRKPLDIDLIGTFTELGELTKRIRSVGHRVNSIPVSPNKTVLRVDDGRIIEFELAWPGTPAAEIVETNWSVSLEGLAGMLAYVPSLDVLYTLKMSHRYLKNSPHFLKTRSDIMLMRDAGAKVFDADWLRRREDETYWYKHPSLNVKKGDFFKGDGVQYVYDHDDIHESVAHIERIDFRFPAYPNPRVERVPAYRLYMKDGAEVQCSKEKFFAAEESVRLYGVLEEAQVLALERSQIPFRGKVEPRRSFDIALQKVCTSITSGWFREFAWENFDRVDAMYEPDYVDRFWKAVECGYVRKLEPGETPSY